eukprot:TRINITY_DN10920_c0_g1_i1.p1 TRINITY_DN10920_c0_g1~~TRINITY_DN10920_c0_g1_i1.p1  ORF type:complete len:205 (+),score=53.82 TRINITY_DN10920_c0_g1_i1:11-625(+)
MSAEILARLETSRYDPEFIEALEAHAASGSYSLDANLALLKLYQFFPQRTQPETIQRVLLAALTKLPATDFLLCMALLSERTLADARVALAVQLWDHLEQSQFGPFWEKLALNSSVTTICPTLEAAAREYAAGLVRLSYRRLSVSQLATILNLSGEKLTKFATAQGWTVEGTSVTIPAAALDPRQQKQYPDFRQFVRVVVPPSK